MVASPTPIPVADDDVASGLRRLALEVDNPATIEDCTQAVIIVQVLDDGRMRLRTFGDTDDKDTLAHLMLAQAKLTQTMLFDPET